VSVYHFDGVD